MIYICCGIDLTNYFMVYLLATNIRTQAGKRVSSVALQKGQNLVQIPHAQVQANLTLNDEIGMVQIHKRSSNVLSS